VLLGAATAGVLWGPADMEPGHRTIASMALGALVFFALLFWLAFLSRIRRGWLVSASLITGLTVLVALVRVDKLSGNFVPSFTWRASKKVHHTLADAIPRTPSGMRETDLSAPSPDDYPQFLGPNRKATLPARSLARDWLTHPPRLIWKRPIGAGWSSFAVVGDYCFTQEQRGNRELVTCCNRHTGELCWSFTDPLVPAPFTSIIAGDGPRATPTVSDGRVFTMGGTGVLNCLDGATGQPIWSRDVLGELGAKNAVWGYSGSPLVWRDRVIVTGGGGAGPALIAYDTTTGERLWASGDAVNGDSYSSPTSAVLCGMEQILVLNDMRAAGHAPDDGRLLWSYDWQGEGPKVSQPVALPGDRVFLSGGYGKGCVLLQLTDRAPGPLLVSEVWPRNRNLKTKFTNVVVRDAFAYGLDEGVLVCLDLDNGKRRWKEGRYGHGQVLLVGDLLLVQSEDGPVHLVDANPDEFRELTSFPALTERTWNNPVLVGRHLYVRNDREAACYELPAATSVVDRETGP
jgi:outer membrane protein assembly factor BamB